MIMNEWLSEEEKKRVNNKNFWQYHALCTRRFYSLGGCWIRFKKWWNLRGKKQ